MDQDNDGWQTAGSKTKRKTPAARAVSGHVPSITAPKRGAREPMSSRSRGRGAKLASARLRPGHSMEVPVPTSIGNLEPTFDIKIDFLKETFPLQPMRYPFWYLLQFRLHPDCLSGPYTAPATLDDSNKVYGVEFLVSIRQSCTTNPTQLLVPKAILKQESQRAAAPPPREPATPVSRQTQELDVWQRAAEAPPSFSENSWLAAQAKEKTDEDKLVERKLRSTLNKLTDANYDRLRLKLLTSCGLSTVVHVDTLIELLFDKAVTQQQSAQLYAHLVKDMQEDLSTVLSSADGSEKENAKQQGRRFKKLLLMKLQESFESSVERRFEPPMDLSEEDRFELFVKYQERQTGLLRFLGMLIQLNLLRKDVAIQIMKDLVRGKDEHKLEALCPFMEHAGPRIMNAARVDTESDEYCQFVETTVRGLSEDETVPVRIRMLLQEALVAHKKVKLSSDEPRQRAP